MNGLELGLIGYPNPRHEKYAVFNVHQLERYKASEWSKDAILKNRPDLAAPLAEGKPVMLSLAEFLLFSPMNPQIESYI